MAHIFMALTWEVAAKNQQVHIWLILLGHYDYHVTSFCWQRSSPSWVVEHHTCICDWGFMLPFSMVLCTDGLAVPSYPCKELRACPNLLTSHL